MENNKKVITLGLDYSQFDGGITEVNRKMGILDAQFKLTSEQTKQFGTETDKLTLKQEQLTQKINLQAQKVKLAKEAYDKAIESGKASDKQLDNLNKAYITSQTALEKLNNELASNRTKIDQSTKSSESFGNSIRGMASSLGLEVSPALETFASKFDGVNKNIGNAVLGIGAIIGTLASFTFAAADTADELLQLSSVTGITTDNLQKMQYASKFLDVEVDTMTDSMTKLTRNMNSARDGSKEQAEAFETLKVKYKEVGGELKSSEEVFYSTIDALGKVKNETERDVLAMTLLGKSAKELNPLIEAGSARLKELGIEAENMGTVMSKDSLDKLGRMKDAMDKLEGTTSALKTSLGLALLPILTGLFEAISKIPMPVMQTLVVLAGAVTTILLVVKAIKSMTDTVKDIKGFFSTFDISTAKTTIKIIGIVAALIALGTVIAILIGKGNDLDRAMTNIGDTVGKVAGTVNNAQSGAYSTAQNANSSAYRGYASGTNNYPGGGAFVGEGGVEYAEFPQGTKIYTNEDTKRMIGGDTYHITIVAEANKIDEVQKVINMAKSQQQAFRRGVQRP